MNPSNCRSYLWSGFIRETAVQAMHLHRRKYPIANEFASTSDLPRSFRTFLFHRHLGKILPPKRADVVAQHVFAGQGEGSRVGQR